MTIGKTVQVTKEASELGDAILGLVQSVQEKAKDGLTATDIAAALTENVGKLMSGLAGIDQLPAESREAPAAAIMAGAVLGAELAAIFVKPQAPQAS